MCTCVYVRYTCVCVSCIYADVYVYIFQYLCVYVCMYVFMYVCTMYVCMYVRIHMHNMYTGPKYKMQSVMAWLAGTA